jgi:hypothetical protein
LAFVIIETNVDALLSENGVSIFAGRLSDDKFGKFTISLFYLCCMLINTFGLKPL